MNKYTKIIAQKARQINFSRFIGNITYVKVLEPLKYIENRHGFDGVFPKYRQGFLYNNIPIVWDEKLMKFVKPRNYKVVDNKEPYIDIEINFLGKLRELQEKLPDLIISGMPDDYYLKKKVYGIELSIKK